MFTGIVTHIGTVARIDKSGGDWKLFISSTMNVRNIEIGASVSCSGCCLTVVDKDQDWLAFNVSNETLSKTVIGSWEAGSRLNLECSLKVGDEIGGHMVTGHVDGFATLQKITPDGDSYRLKIELPDNLAVFLAPKGCVTLDGISLTVNEVEGNVFGVNIIPHTWVHTSIAEKKVGDIMNFEADPIARYVARYMGKA